MADNLQAPLTVVPLPAGSRIVLEAVDPTSGAAISTVMVSNVVISGTSRNDVAEDTGVTLGPLLYIPGSGA